MTTQEPTRNPHTLSEAEQACLDRDGYVSLGQLLSPTQLLSTRKHIDSLLQAEGEDAAYEFLAKHEDLWSKWVTEAVAAKVKAGIK